MLENVDSFCSNNVIIAGDFNFFFSKKLECKDGDPYLDKTIIKSYTKFLLISAGHQISASL